MTSRTKRLERGVATAAGTRTRRWRRSARPATLVAALLGTMAAAVAAPGGTAAQEPERERTRDRCICVDSLTALRGNWGPGEIRVNTFGSRARIGVTLSTNETPDAEGVRIERVTRDGPADRAGLRSGDMITAIDGRRLSEPVAGEEEVRGMSRPGARLVSALREVEPGDTVEIEYRRDGRTHTASVETRGMFDFPFGSLDDERLRGSMERLRGELRALPTAQIRALAPSTLAWGTGWARANGVELTDLNSELGGYFGTEEGVLVLRVDENATFGLRAGDVILRIDGREVTDAAHAMQILRSYREDERVGIEIVRQGSEMTIEGRGVGRRR